MPTTINESVEEELHRVMENPDLAAHTITRLRAERDRLRNEVVELRGDIPHEYEPDLSPERLASTMQFRCSLCGRRTSTPTHAYFDPCPGQ